MDELRWFDVLAAIFMVLLACLTLAGNGLMGHALYRHNTESTLGVLLAAAMCCDSLMVGVDMFPRAINYFSSGLVANETTEGVLLELSTRVFVFSVMIKIAMVIDRYVALWHSDNYCNLFPRQMALVGVCISVGISGLVPLFIHAFEVGYKLDPLRYSSIYTALDPGRSAAGLVMDLSLLALPSLSLLSFSRWCHQRDYRPAAAIMRSTRAVFIVLCVQAALWFVSGVFEMAATLIRSKTYTSHMLYTVSSYAYYLSAVASPVSQVISSPVFRKALARVMPFVPLHQGDNNVNVTDIEAGTRHTGERLDMNLILVEVPDFLQEYPTLDIQVDMVRENAESMHADGEGNGRRLSSISNSSLSISIRCGISPDEIEDNCERRESILANVGSPENSRHGSNWSLTSYLSFSGEVEDTSTMSARTRDWSRSSIDNKGYLTPRVSLTHARVFNKSYHMNQHTDEPSRRHHSVPAAYLHSADEKTISPAPCCHTVSTNHMNFPGSCMPSVEKVDI